MSNDSNSIQNNTNYEYLFKIILIGSSGVGKSSILQRYMKKTFDENYKITIGVDFLMKTLTINKQLVKLQVWDTAGQEKYKSLTKFFYKDAAMVILVYDITRRESFDNLKNYWYKEIQEYGEKDIVLGIAGNKSDLYDNEAVPEKEARDFAKSINAIFALTSAQNNSGVTKLFEDIGNKYLDPNFQEKVSDAQKQHSQSIAINKEQHNEQTKEKKKKKGFC